MINKHQIKIGNKERNQQCKRKKKYKIKFKNFKNFKYNKVKKKLKKINLNPTFI